jgi:hypothetical protein
MHRTGISDVGLLCLAEAKCGSVGCSELTSLNVGYNTCTKLGLSAVSSALLDGAFPKLQELVFQGNSINHVHIVAMAEQWSGPCKEQCTQLLKTQRWDPS